MPHQKNEPIAIVGSGCRFAGSVNSPSKLWEFLSQPKDLRQKVPASRFSVNGFYHPDGSYHGHSNIVHAYLLNDEDDPTAFDSEFFGIKIAEAKAMDPQQRVLLEVIYEAIESAGLSISRMKGSDTAIYVGSMTDDYTAILLRDLQAAPTYTSTGTARSMLSNRASYVFDWHGPSVSVDTACSASLVAVHMAVQTLRAGDSRTALACGTNLILGPENFVVESKLNMLSPDGRCRMWDQEANGYARGEGVAALVLKTVSAALEDGDDIECIIRETRLNQDGSTSGITMPSAFAQETLIRETYSRAGLDLAARADRPQYFEAHGTGTPAGDPIEAEAIYNALGARLRDSGEDPLFVGSIKTVLGHTEGTAGVAAILKASLSLQHAQIAPNLWFERLSDSVVPFYKNVEIPRALRQWPSVVCGIRRASVNSFGFGGANAHAILESVNVAPDPVTESKTATEVLFTPFVFSSFSHKSLAASLDAYRSYLDDRGRSLNLHDLAWTLRERRSILGRRTALTAQSLDDLRATLHEYTSDEKSLATKTLPASRNCTLAVFTGQGAQYPRMGAELIQKSKKAREIVSQLDLYLADLPDGDAPVWSLVAELLAATSRVHEASISQPLCTAVQILLVDLLRLAGVSLDAVVGHSSGEIGAAYAAGFLNARDAIRIAFYRGLHLQHASKVTQNGQHIKGAMVAVGTSPEDAVELCSDSVFKGRIFVAANNSSSSVTISGDEDAITELEMVLEDDKIFYRRLRVDQAYHSPRMLPCYDPFVSSLRRCGVAPQTPGPKDATWFSSVYNGMTGTDLAGLGDTYWADNMTRPVLFSETARHALSSQAVDLVVEVGPHPALKAPMCQVMLDELGEELPYHGTLTRGKGAIEAMSSLLGFLWTLLEPSRIDLNGYELAMNGESRQYRLIKGLPTYSWNHNVKYWHESRRSRKMRTRPQKVHQLLGDVSSDSSPHHMSWRHVLSVGEIRWLSGHRVHGQVVFPAAGYLCSAIEASRYISESLHPGNDVRLIEIHDFTIHQPITFDDEVGGIEVFISMAEVTARLPDRASAKFTYSAALPSQDAGDLTLAASCHVEIVTGNTNLRLLPVRKPRLPHMLDVEPDRFYAALADLGYGLTGRFQSLMGMHRKHCRSTSLVKMGPRDEEDGNLLVHPAELDAALQSIILAYSHPYDEELRMMHLPTSIQKIRINPALCSTFGQRQDQIAATDAGVSERGMGERGITGQVDLYSDSSEHAAIQVEKAIFMPLGGTVAADDRTVFSKVHWIRSKPDGDNAADHIVLTREHCEVVKVLERTAIFYLRKFDSDIPFDHPSRLKLPTNWYLKFAKHVTSVFENGKNPWAQDSWLHDTLEDVIEAGKPYWQIPDLQIMHLVGAQMPQVFDGETTMLEQFRAGGNDILDKYYTDGFGVKEAGEWVGRSVKQIASRYPHMNILEIGAGTGGGTKAVFSEIGQDFHSYTYTDISAAFLEGAATTFHGHRDRMIFKTFDVERSPAEQGYIEGTFDLVVAFLILHATSNIHRSLTHIRRLLKPGGFLVVAEGYDAWDGFAKAGFIWGTLPGWWLRDDAQRNLSPHLSSQQWDEKLRSTGFSGVDTSLPTEFQGVLSMFCFVSQAINTDVEFLRQPLAAPSARLLPIEKLVLVGGQTPRTSSLVQGLQRIFTKNNLSSEFHQFKTLLDVDYGVVDSNSTVISLTEIDKPVFKDIGPEVFTSLKAMFTIGKTLLWITSGRMDNEPFSNMTVGFGNVAANETPGLYLQQLDIANPAGTKPEVVAEILLRFHSTVAKASTALWTVEPQILLDEEGHEMLPRLRPILELNDRYNSARRHVVREINLENSTEIVTLQYEPTLESFTIRELPHSIAQRFEIEAAEPYIEFRTMYSTLSAIRTPCSHKFLALGIEPETKRKYLTLVPLLASASRLPLKSTVPCLDLDIFPGYIISIVSAHLVALHVLSAVFPGQTVLVHNPSYVIAKAIEGQAALKGVRVVFVTDSENPDVPESWMRLPQFITQSDAEVVLSSVCPSCFAGFSEGYSESQTTLMDCLRGDCKILLTAGTIYSSRASDDRLLCISVLRDTLSQALEYARRDLLVDEIGLQYATHITVPLRDVVAGVARRGGAPSSVVVDWTAPQPLPMYVRRLDSMPVFEADSSYWIVGMSRALGLSLADWMIRKGARTMILTSRKPDVDPKWLKFHEQNGVNVVILPCDVTDKSGLQAVYSQICSTLPPVKGVINGAMVLRDTTISKMTFNQLEDVLRPKVQGSINLDSIFHDRNLDFFVLMSSINRVFGNHGQANYAAANSFLWSLAAQRRKRGLRAATVDIGAIIGAGYLERELRRELDAIVERYNMLRMSEEDWCQCICEAIDACRLDSPHGPGLTTGLLEVSLHATKPPSWHTNPMFSVFVTSQGTPRETEVSKEKVPLAAELHSCQSAEDVFQIIERWFAAKLRTMLQISVPDEDIMTSRSNELGLDSLVAVDISTWFLKQLEIKIPVLKILGNVTMGNIVQYAVNNVPAKLVPGVGADGLTGERGDDSMSKHSSQPQSDTVTSEDEDVSSLTTISESVEIPDGDMLQVSRKENCTFDWEMESRPPADFAEIPVVSTPQQVRSPPRVIILTGCTGLLGHHLLSCLLDQPTVSSIICLAVRGLSSLIKQGKVPSTDPRVEYRAGDLAMPFLGLTENEASSIFVKADVAIHIGADTSHLKHYSDVRLPNVGSTTALTRLCLANFIPLHYVSSVGLGLWHQNSRIEGFSPGPLKLALGSEPDGSFGYLCSKWTCERLLERTSQLYGLRVYIHRPSTIVREGEDALGQRAERDWVNAYITYAKRLHAVPSAKRNRGNLDLVYVETVCEGIIRQVFHEYNNTSRHEGTITYVHEVGDMTQPLGSPPGASQLEVDGISCKVLPLEEWIAQAVAAGLHPGVAALIDSMVEEEDDYPRFLAGESHR